MPQENYAAKQQRIGERLTRAMAKAHMNRSELAELTGYSVELGARARADVPDRADKTVSCARREAGVAAVLGAPPPLISSASVFHRYPSCCSPVFLIHAAHHRRDRVIRQRTPKRLG